MPSRSARRNAHKRLVRGKRPGEAPHSPMVCRWLEYWQRQARHRAGRLGAPAAWGLLREPTVRALLEQLDATGELTEVLGRLVAEAVAQVSDPRLVRSCRPLSQPVPSRG